VEFTTGGSKEMKIEVDQYQNIRYLYIVQGLSKREIARRLGISRNTVAKYCEGRQVPWKRKTYHRKPTVITPEVEEFIETCLKEDQKFLISETLFLREPQGCLITQESW
jgi:transposase